LYEGFLIKKLGKEYNIGYIKKIIYFLNEECTDFISAKDI